MRALHMKACTSVETMRGHTNTATVAGTSPCHQKRHADSLYTPRDENGSIERTILPVTERPATRMGRESACQ
jgi:hypothetical protein